VIALVAGLSGVNVAVAQSGPTGGAIGIAEARVGVSIEDSLRAIQPAAQPSFYDDEDADNEEEEIEDGQEDGLLPGGQAEQRAQALGDKAEGRDEDHENSGGE
jgi:hypothetical protein